MEICSELSFKRGAHYAVGVVMWRRKKTLSQWLPLGRVESVNKFTSVVVLD